MKKINIPNFLFALLAFGSIMVSSCGKKETIVKIENAPGPNFDASAVVIKPGEIVDFTSTSTGDITSYIWSFPGADVTTSKEKDPKGIKYSRPGRYTVSLTTNGPSGSNTVSRLEYIFVNGLDLPLTLDAKDSIFLDNNYDPYYYNYTTALLYKKGRIENFNPKIRYDFKIIFSSTSDSLYFGDKNQITPTVTGDGKISFAIPLIDETTSYRLYVTTSGGEDESYSPTYKFTSPRATFSAIGGPIVDYSKVSFSGNIAAPINLFRYGMCWVKGNGEAKISDNFRYIFPESNGDFDTSIAKFNVPNSGAYNIRFFSRIGEIITYYNSYNINVDIPPVTFSNITGPTVLGNSISFTGKISDLGKIGSYGICWVSGDGPATISNSTYNYQEITTQLDGNFYTSIPGNIQGKRNFRFYYRNRYSYEITYIQPSYTYTTPNIIGFENGTPPSWSLGNWVITSSTAYSGNYSLANPQYASTGTNTASFSFTTTQNSSFSFYWYTYDFSSSSDIFQVIIDGNINTLPAPYSTWTPFTYSISAGSHNISFKVIKNSSSLSWATGVYIDNITY